jgi:hypothetical protein
VYKYCTDDSCPGQVDFVQDGIRYKQEMMDNGTL